MITTKLNRRRTGAAVGVALAFVLCGRPIATAAAGDCAAELTAVETAIVDAQFLGARADEERTNLLATLDDAEAKIAARQGRRRRAQAEEHLGAGLHARRRLEAEARRRGADLGRRERGDRMPRGLIDPTRVRGSPWRSCRRFEPNHVRSADTSGTWPIRGPRCVSCGSVGARFRGCRILPLVWVT